MAECWNGLTTEEDFQLLEGASVEVYIGPEEHCWVLQTGLLSHLSSYFKAALNGNFKEAEERRVTLEEDDPAVFRIFVAWLYTGAIKDWSEMGVNLEKAWILGDKLGAPAFQDCVMISLLDGSGHLLYHPHIVEHIYSHTPEGSPLRALAADSVVFYYRDVAAAKAEWMALFSRGGDFVVDVMRAFLVWEDVESPSLVRAKYLINARAALRLDCPSRARTPAEQSCVTASNKYF